MREIKFRAWIKDYALMADVNFLNIDYKEIVVMIDESDYEFNCGEYELMQYTGLKDKNGTEIYEGDIVEVIHEDGFKTIGQVVWGLDDHRYGNYPAFTIPEFDSDLNSFAEIFDSGYYEIEVIGNIHEHKHLLGRE